MASKKHRVLPYTLSGDATLADAILDGWGVRDQIELVGVPPTTSSSPSPRAPPTSSSVAATPSSTRSPASPRRACRQSPPRARASSRASPSASTTSRPTRPRGRPGHQLPRLLHRGRRPTYHRAHARPHAQGHIVEPRCRRQPLGPVLRLPRAPPVHADAQNRQTLCTGSSRARSTYFDNPMFYRQSTFPEASSRQIRYSLCCQI